MTATSASAGGSGSGRTGRGQVGLLEARDLPEAVALLQESGLPVEDLGTARPVLFAVRNATVLAAVAGLERYGEVGLLRSLAVRPERRGSGLGAQLVAAVERHAAQEGVRDLFLLTTTAEPFFARRGYMRADRGQAPAAIRGTTEFASVCPSTAVFMVKRVRPWRVLILCTGNSARSQIAEALLERKGAGRFEVQSAGSRPAGRVHPLALRVLSEAGIDWSGKMPKGLDGLDREPWDFVITVCDRAREACPILPGTPVLAHWGMPDPTEVSGSEDTILRAFRETLDVLSRRIDLFLALPPEQLDRQALARRAGEIGQG